MTERTEPISVLAVDDSAEFLAAVCAWIESQPGLRLCGTAGNGREALEALDGARPDLVLMDALMPEIDGFEATRHIKTGDGAPLVVMLSVHEGSAIENEAWAAGADGFVSKRDFAGRLPQLIRDLVAAGAERRGGGPGDPARPGAPDPTDGGAPPARPRTPDAPAERSAEGSGPIQVLPRGVRALFRNIGKDRRPGGGSPKFSTEGGFS